MGASTRSADGLERKVVVVTGASAGVGRAVAQAFAREGADVGLIARGRAGLDGARRDVESAGGRSLVLELDVSDAHAVDRAAERVEQELGPIEVWVNNAMLSVFSPAKEMRPEEYRRVTEVTYLGFVHGTLAAMKRMLPRDRGTIVQVGSALAYRGIPLQSAYCGAKHAVQGFTESVRCELFHDKSNVWITMVQMPALNTPQFDWVRSRLPHRAQPVPPIFEPEVAAQAVLWASKHRRREVFVGGSTWQAINANKFVPDLLDRYLGWTGFKSQQTDDAEPPDRPDNLWQPVDATEDHGARGRFGDRASGWSAQLEATTHRGLIATGVGLVGLLASIPSLLGGTGRR